MQTACRFWIVNWTVTRRPFQSPVALAISSPTFLGDCGITRSVYAVVIAALYDPSLPLLLRHSYDTRTCVPPPNARIILVQFSKFLVPPPIHAARKAGERTTYETERTDLGSESGGRSDFSSGGPEVDDFNLEGVDPALCHTTVVSLGTTERGCERLTGRRGERVKRGGERLVASLHSTSCERFRV